MSKMTDLSDRELQRLCDRREKAYYEAINEKARRNRIRDYGSEILKILNEYQMLVCLSFPVSVYAKTGEGAENIVRKNIYPYGELAQQIEYNDMPGFSIDDIELTKPGETESNKQTIDRLRAVMGEAV